MNTADQGGHPAKRRGLADTLELDKRLFGMLIAFAILCVVFHFATDGKFMTPRNIFNVSVQTVSVACASGNVALGAALTSIGLSLPPKRVLVKILGE